MNNEVKWLKKTDRGLILLEPVLASHVLDIFNTVSVNGLLLDTYGENITAEIEQYLLKEISQHFASPVTKVANVLKQVKILAIQKATDPETDTLYAANCSVKFNETGVVPFNAPQSATLLRFQWNYVPNSPTPKKWLNFLYDLLPAKDVDILQEFMGYCLVPSTAAQEALIILGKGGEGKSVIGRVIQKLWGNKVLFDKIQNLDEDRFLFAQLVNRLVFVDDDLETKKLEKTGVFKQIVTNTNKVLVEDKYTSKFPVNIFTRFVLFGNNPVQALYDGSEGFFRRLKILRCKPVSKNRKTDRLFFEKNIEPELEEIFNWCIKGLLRVFKNNFELTQSDTTMSEKEDLKSDSINIYDFLCDSDYLEYRLEKSYVSSTATLYEAYCDWCKANGTVPMALRSFSTFLKSNADDFSIEYSNHIKLFNGTSVRGFKGVKTIKKYLTL